MFKKALFTIIFLVLLSVPATKVFAANDSTLCGLLPCNQYQTGGLLDPNADVNANVSNVIKAAVGLVFVGIIILGIFLIVRAGLTIIRSEGNEEKIGEGQNTIKGVFIGLGIIFVGIIGLVILLAFFGGGVGNININAPANVNLPLVTD